MANPVAGIDYAVPPFFAMPGAGASPIISVFGGQVRYVKKTTDADYGPFYAQHYQLLPDGTSSMYNTVQSAVNAASANDRIYVLPGDYAENVTISKNSLAMIGVVPSGISQRPRIRPATGVPLTVSAQGFTATHMGFTAADAHYATVQEGDGYVYTDCIFGGRNGGQGGLRLIPSTDGNTNLQTASQGFVLNCIFRNNVGASLTFSWNASLSPTDIVVDGCRFYTNTTSDILDDLNGAGASVLLTDVFISNCYFLDLNKTNYIDVSNGTGNLAIISNCFFAIKTGASRLAASQVKLEAGVVATGLYDSTGIVDSHTF